MYRKFTASLFTIIIISLISCQIAENQTTALEESSIKEQLCPAAYEPAWAIKTVSQMFEDVGYGRTSMTDMPQNIWTSVVTQLFVRLGIREKEFAKIRDEKYSDCSNDITLDGIRRGDVLLSVTHNAMLMAPSGEGDLIHATLCISDPTVDNDMAFLSIQRMDGVVEILPLTDLRKNASQVIVMRYESITDEQIDTIVSYCKQQLGKPYNMNFTNKWETNSFYCTQLIWRAFYEAGLQIDFDHEVYNDYGVVFARDIFKCDKMKVIKWSE
ncbi:MAG: hypothetical protein J6Y01_09845 [Spirochaetales bacterium]|nr:hypothetical protein [Spirochaetales bacterium]